MKTLVSEECTDQGKARNRWLSPIWLVWTCHKQNFNYHFLQNKTKIEKEKVPVFNLLKNFHIASSFFLSLTVLYPI